MICSGIAGGSNTTDLSKLQLFCRVFFSLGFIEI